MTNKYLEKIAGVAFQGNKITHARVAEKHGKTPEPKSDLQYMIDDQKSGMRATGRGVLTSVGGAVVGSHVGASLANRAIKRGATTLHRGVTFRNGLTVAGAATGYVAGVAKSFSNQNKEIENKYKSK